jgi:hypothetical protein
MYIARYIFFEADVFGHFTKFTKIKLRTATFFLGNVGGTLGQAAAFFLSTGQTSMRMIGENRN